MNFFDNFRLIIAVICVIELIVVCISEKLFPKEHPKYATVFLSLSVVCSALVSAYFTSIIFEVVLT